MADVEVVKTDVSGKIRWFSNSKGYGFITSEGIEEDIFVHYSSIVEEGYKTLKEDQEVLFTLVRVESGKLQATEVTKV